LIKVKILTVAVAIITLTLAFTPLAGAEEIAGISTPPEDLGVVNVGDTVILNFTAEFRDSLWSVAMISVSFYPEDWSYEGFSAEMDGVNVTEQFNLVVDGEKGVVELSATSLEPVNGVLSVSVAFKALGRGSYTFGWSYVFIAMPPPGPNVPAAGMDFGDTHVTVKKPKPLVSPLTVGAVAIVAAAILVAAAFSMLRRRSQRP